MEIYSLSLEQHQLYFRKRKRKNFRTTKEKELVHKVKHKKKLTQRSRKIQTRKGNK
jgi:hypothetical protein